jgi:hypothetical protein
LQQNRPFPDSRKNAENLCNGARQISHDSSAPTRRLRQRRAGICHNAPAEAVRHDRFNDSKKLRGYGARRVENVALQGIDQRWLRFFAQGAK